MNKLAVIVVLGVGLGAVAGVYWFRANRLTAADIAAIAAAQQRVEAVQAQSGGGGSDPSAASAEGGQLASSENPAKAGDKPAPGSAPQGLAAASAPKAAGEGKVTVIPIESMPDKTPDTFTVLFETTKGDFAVEFSREWAPNGVDRIYELVMKKFFTDMRAFRAVENFVVQFGIPGSPAVSVQWKDKNIPDDPAMQSNTEGMFTFAAAGSPNTRSTQVFVNLRDNSRLDEMGFAPVGKVVFGMDIVKSLYSGYGDPPKEEQELITAEGNAFLDRKYPLLDSIKRAMFIEEIREAATNAAAWKQTASPAEGNLARGVSERAPDTFKVKFECSMGTFVAECYREWSPLGADRFYTLVKNGFYNEAKFFRVMPGFIVQFGLPAEADVRGTWIMSTFPDDPFKVSNTEGTLVFAKPARPNNARATQIFINLGDNTNSLDPQSFTPFGKIIEGMDIVRRINAEYGKLPDQGSVRAQGNAYLDENFPRLDGIKSATLMEDAPAAAQPAAVETTPAGAP